MTTVELEWALAQISRLRDQRDHARKQQSQAEARVAQRKLTIEHLQDRLARLNHSRKKATKILAKRQRGTRTQLDALRETLSMLPVQFGLEYQSIPDDADRSRRRIRVFEGHHSVAFEFNLLGGFRRVVFEPRVRSGVNPGGLTDAEVTRLTRIDEELFSTGRIEDKKGAWLMGLIRRLRGLEDEGASK